MLPLENNQKFTSEESSVKFLFVSFSYSSFIKLQVFLIISSLIVAGLFYYYGRLSDYWWLRNAWWLCILVAIVEVFESILVIRNVKKNSD